MSSSYIVEPQEGTKKDDTLILMVNDNGVISVDQDTLQNLILNQSNATVSVVRLGQTDNDAVEGNITLTVDPPPFVPSETNATNTSDPSALVDPFMEMDPEQLERLETALQSEEAKQILGENVTAMLDMLTVEERQNSIRYSIELDHCYTSRFSPSQPKPADPLPDMSSSDMDESMCIDLNKSSAQTPVLLPVSSANVNNTSITPIKQKVTPTLPKIVKQPVSIGSRPRRASAAMQPITTTPKSTVSSNVRTIQTLNSVQETRVHSKEEEEAEDDELFSSSESSESSESDSDSDFGVRSSRRRVRARGGRRGLTTRGGSMAAARRRGSNKQMDSEQVRRLDLEMAAAVNAMKSPEKEEKLEKQSPNKPKKPLLKTFGGKKKDDVPTPSTPVSEAPPIETNVLQTTNQVKANLISANMFKGDMILTKPGQDRNNQKVVFVQKQVMMNPNDLKTLGIKKQVMIPKSKLITTPSKVPMSKETKISPPVVMKGTITTMHQPTALRQNITPMETQTEPIPNPVQSQKTVSPPVVKTKPVEIKKEKKKIETNSDTPVKPALEASKHVETKTPVAPKKIVKKEHRKSDTHVVEALGPALFSTPDIIRRVGSTESKAPEHTIATMHASPLVAISSASISTPSATAVVNTSTISSSPISSPSVNAPIPSINIPNMLDEPMETSATDSANNSLTAKLDTDASMLTDTLENDKMDNKTAIAELLQPALDTTSNSTPSKEIPSAMENTSNSKHVSESGIEGDDHLLATLGMEAAKQLPNDEELLAEALLLQETLGVDLDHSGLVDPTPEMPETILSAPILESAPSVMPPKVEPVSITTPSALLASTPKVESAAKKDVKEPIQVIRRGGRVITLPPIEAPATRSKRLQAKAENQQVKVEKKPHLHQQQQQPKVEPLIIKTERSTRTPTHVSLKKQDMIYDIDDDDEEEEEMEEANSDSEDDPNRLWCICRQPHNNRFMICCDMCQDWFHGKCVNVTKSMGEQMEKQGIEWVCPNCSKKKNEESKSKTTPRRQRNSVDSTSNEQNRTPSVSNVATLGDTKPIPNSSKNSSASTGVTHCVVCKKEARKSSIYCSDACILAHAEVTSTKDKPSPAPPTKTLKTDTPKLKQDVRIIVYDKKTGKVLTGADAPTASNLKTWLKEHPTYEVFKSNNLNTIQLGGKTVSAIQAQGIKTNKLLEGKSPGQAKMVYSKIPGSKQTVLASSAKKGAFLSEVSPVRATASPQHRLKQVTAATPNKTPIANLKQTTIKTTQPQQQPQQQQNQLRLQQQHQQHQHQQPNQQMLQKPVATSTPKAPSIKKSLEAKPSTSQQKPPAQPKQQPQQQKQQQPQQQKQQQQQPQKQQQQQQQQKQQQQQQQPPAVTKTPPQKKPDTEPIRLAVRKTLAEYLTTRIKETKDLTLTEDEILELALQIELEMFKFFKDTGSKYKSKYRSLLFNIKDPKNLTLFRKIADRSLTPNALVKLSPEEMASQELAEWREKENKHQLEMIKKNELDLMAQAKSIVVKTHKGEQIIENDGSIDKVDPETPVQDIVTALSGDISSTVEEDNKEKDEEDIKFKSFEEKKKKEKDRDREKRRGRSRDRSSKDISKRDRSSSKGRHRHSKDRDRSRDKKSKKDSKHKDRDRTREHKSRDHDKKKDKDRKDKRKRSRSHSRSHSKNRHKDHKDKHKKDEEKKKDTPKTEVTGATPDKPIEDRLWRHIEDETTTNTLDDNESDVSDREPSSTVTIKTPDINEELDNKEIVEPKINEGPKGTITVWRGTVYMADVAKFSVTAQNVSGNCKQLLGDLPDHFDVVGRIHPYTVWDYISKMKKNATKEILIIRLTAINDEEKIPYITLYSYLNNRNRFGVIGKTSPFIKDFYIMPFSNSSILPSVLLPFDGPGLEENRQHLLLGIIVVHSRTKRVATMPPALTPVPAKMAKKDQQLSERSYTPPPTSLSGKDESMTPPSSPRPVTQIRMVTQEVKQSFSVISKIVPELSSKITLESSSSSDKMQLDDDDEPYSPGEPVDVAIDDEDALSSSSSLKMPQTTADTTVTSPIKSSTDLQRKMEELSRQIEEEKQQIQSISSSFLGDASTTLPGLGLDPPNTGEVVEAYSPTDAGSFTPPPQGISKLTQPILEKVSNITIPPNLQEILANVKRQENSKVDPYLPSKPSATFLTTVNSTMYQNQDKYSPTYSKTSNASRSSSEVQSSPRKESKSTLSSLSDYDIMKKAEEELAALAAASAAVTTTSVPPPATVAPPGVSPVSNDPPPPGSTFDSPHR